MRAVIAPKKDASVGDDAERDVDVAEAGEVGGESWLVDDLDDCVVCEEAVFVRMGGGMCWLCDDAIVGQNGWTCSSLDMRIACMLPINP